MVGAGYGSPSAPTASARTEHTAEQVLHIHIVPGVGVPERARGTGPAPSARPPAAGTAPRIGLRPTVGGRVHVRTNSPEIFSERVVPFAQVRVGEHVIRLGEFLEPVFRFGILVDVGVELAGKSAIGPLDLRRVGITGDAENLIGVPGH